MPFFICGGEWGGGGGGGGGAGRYILHDINTVEPPLTDTPNIPTIYWTEADAQIDQPPSTEEQTTHRAQNNFQI